VWPNPHTDLAHARGLQPGAATPRVVLCVRVRKGSCHTLHNRAPAAWAAQQPHTARPAQCQDRLNNSGCSLPAHVLRLVGQTQTHRKGGGGWKNPGPGARQAQVAHQNSAAAARQHSTGRAARSHMHTASRTPVECRQHRHWLIRLARPTTSGARVCTRVDTPCPTTSGAPGRTDSNNTCKHEHLQPQASGASRAAQRNTQSNVPDNAPHPTQHARRARTHPQTTTADHARMRTKCAFLCPPARPAAQQPHFCKSCMHTDAPTTPCAASSCPTANIMVQLRTMRC
jgi:hypothetical protein